MKIAKIIIHKLRIFSQYNIVELFLLISVMLLAKLQKLIFKLRQDLFEIKIALEYIADNNGRFKKINRCNILTIIDDQMLGGYKIKLRRRTSDFAVFNQILISKEYKTLIALIKTKKDEKNIKYIIDAGANIGCSTIFLKKNFRQAMIVAIEPEPNNYTALLENIRLNGLHDIVPLNKGMWINGEDLEIGNNYGDKREWAFMTKQASKKSMKTIKGITIYDVIKNYEIPTIDILKIDIEGAEHIVFEQEIYVRHFLPFVRYLVMEIHGDSRHILDLLTKYSFETNFVGEWVIGKNNDMKSV